MTRFARRGPENKKKHEATDWDSLKEGLQKPKAKRNKSDSDSNAKYKKSWPKIKGKKITAEEHLLATAFKKEQRREQRRVKRITERAAKQVCFNCRLPGHKVGECMMLADDPTQGTGICFKCGSTEHSASACQVKVAPGSYPYAKCFVCGQKGHISRLCPDNPKGAYPKGGGCKFCNDVSHLKRDCPEFLRQQGISSAKIEKIKQDESVDAEAVETKSEKLNNKVKKPKL
ncbi:zinc finger CCHC domain-containing protein 9-like isoform X2 [Pomacea canaliculata]|nr:zinc finger CCHC domain-containing protein 9-like isoform X2 [Pomacea canaliculata]XP_025077304.1 zinc finger CCHC domain-containing protein 9-like isoform X2 [Pomacea canaliculata]XP_025077305.1 zinc finger CCHC domain-containing protein 9-like isoform X2 [Pomacea canaliculata]